MIQHTRFIVFYKPKHRVGCLLCVKETHQNVLLNISLFIDSYEWKKKKQQKYMNCVFRILLMLFSFQFSCSCCRFLLLRLETDSYVGLRDCLLFVAYDTHRIVWLKRASITCYSPLFVFNSRSDTCVCAPFSLITTIWHSKKIVIKIHYSFRNILITWPRM